MVFQALAALSSPFALNNLLAYLETRGEGAEVRPWVWVALMFLGPTIYFVLSQQYYRVNSHVIAFLETVLTQLVLEHSLRIRMVAEPSEEAAVKSNKSSPTQTPRSDTPTVTEPPSSSSGGDQETNVGEGEESTLAESNGTLNTSTSTVVPTPPDTPAKDEKSKNLVGRMNSLITSDLVAVGNAMEFMQPLLLGPCLITGCVVFLYILLGWSAFVGVGGMILQLPVPIWVARLLQSTTKKVTEKVGEQVL